MEKHVTSSSLYCLRKRVQCCIIVAIILQVCSKAFTYRLPFVELIRCWQVISELCEGMTPVEDNIIL